MKRISAIMTVLLSGILLATPPGLLPAASGPSLTVSAREIDLGVIGPGEQSRASFTIGCGDGAGRWSLEGPSSWETLQGRGLAGECIASSRVDVTLTSVKASAGAVDHRVQVRVVSGRRTLVMQQALAEGAYREALRIETETGSRTLFLKFSLADAKSRPSLEVEPRGFDLGDTEPVRETTRRIRISNGGAGVLRWQASSSGAGSARALAATDRGRYLSFQNEGLAAGAPYSAPAPLKDALQVTGNCPAEKGCPKAAGEGCLLRLIFQGTGVVLYGRKLSEGGVLRAAVDDRPPREMSLQDTEGGRFEWALAEILAEGPHILQIQADEGAVVLEGVFAQDPRASVPPSSWIRLTPLSGTTSRETDFVTLRMSLSDLRPGVYTDHVTITSNGGTVHVPVTLNISGEPSPKQISVYRYTRGADQLFTSQPDKEDPRYIGAYQRAGLAFRLFGPGTAGTVELYRWYNPAIGDHYYSAERSGGRKNLAGYLFGGAIGNIATIRLPGTRELYRWFNAETGHHFFTTDVSGEGMGRRGYKFEGTVGFVLR